MTTITINDNTGSLVVAAPGPQGAVGPEGPNSASSFASIPISGNPMTLSSVQAANAIVVLTDPLTGPVTAPQVVDLPVGARSMVVANGMSSTYLLTLGMTGGTATVNVPKGNAVAVYCDGLTGVYAVSSVSGLQFNGVKPVTVTNTALDSTYSGAYTALATPNMATVLPQGSTMQPGGSIFLDCLAAGQTITPYAGDTANFGATLTGGINDRFMLTWNGTSWRMTLYTNRESPVWATSAGAPLLSATSRAIIGGGADDGVTALQVKGAASFTVAPTMPTMAAGDNSTHGANTAYVTAAINALIAAAPGTLNTLNELATALGDNPNFATTVTNSLATKLALAGGTLTGALALAYAAPALTLSDTSQSGGAGIFEWVSTGGVLKLLRNTAAAGNFSTSTAPVQYSAADVATFLNRPVFNGATPWDTANFTPLNYAPLGGATFTGAVVFSNTTTHNGSASFTAGLTSSNTTTVSGAASFTSATATSFTVRPTFNGNTPWDSGNFNPASYLALAGGTVSGAATFSGGLTVSTSALLVSAAATFSGATGFTSGTATTFSVRPTFNGATPYDNTNLNPALFAPLAGGSFTGAVTFGSTTAHNGAATFTAGLTSSNTTTISGAASFTSATATSFTVRPTFNGNTPWDTGNLLPSNYAPLAGATFSGPVTFSSTTAHNGAASFTAGLTSSSTTTISGAASFTNATATSFSVRPTFNGNLAWDAGNLTPASYAPLAGATFVGAVTLQYASPVFTLNSPVGGQNRLVGFQTSGSQRWNLGANNATEAGSNVGSDLVINRYADAGTYVDTPFTLTRSTGQLSLTQRPVFAANTPWDSGNFNPANYLALTGGTVSGAMTISGAVNFGARPTYQGSTLWDAGNLTPANYLPLAGGTLTGLLTTASAGVKFGDGTTQTTAYVAGAGSFPDFADTLYTSGLFTAASAGVGLAAANATATSMDLNIAPKGNGALYAGPVADNLATGGYRRGTYSVDWQRTRLSASNTATGASSVIGGGANNTASGSNSTVAGGAGSVASSSWATVGGGGTNTASNQYATVSGGSTNTASGYAATIAGGYNSSATGNYSAVLGGYGATANGAYSIASGGYSVTNGIAGQIAEGYAGTGSVGSSQRTRTQVWALTTSTTATRATSDGNSASVSNQLTLRPKSAFRVSVKATAFDRTNFTDVKEWSGEFLVVRGAAAANTAIVGNTAISTTNATAGASGWTLAVSADTTNGAFAATVTSTTTDTVQWCINLDAIEAQ